ALSRLGARKIQTMITPVIFSSEIASSFFSTLINAISGSNIYQKSTFLINCFQKRIFPEWLNIKEDPHIKKGL
ncbi:MAG: metallopeptidase TldD-related protein, partial [Candidatus Blochmannia sp. A2]|nr:metallopeptidase TldD-related protein [Candidatus Blochmannia sp. A2]